MQQRAGGALSEADTQKLVSTFWAVTQPGRPDDASQAGLALMAGARPPVADLICNGHPAVLDQDQALSAKLCNSPAVVHAAAMSTCAQQAPAVTGVALDFSAAEVLSGASTLDTLAKWACAAMQLRPEPPQVTLVLRGSDAKVFDSALTAADQFVAVAGCAAVAGLLLTGSKEFSAGMVAISCEAPFYKIARTAEQGIRMCSLLQRVSSGLQSLEMQALNGGGTDSELPRVQAFFKIPVQHVLAKHRHAEQPAGAEFHMLRHR
jgi:hypothetical protein